MGFKELSNDQLYAGCDLAALPFETTEDLTPLDDIIGQPRALEAIQMGIAMHGEGYNIFALGHPGVGRRTMVHQFLNQQAPSDPAPGDWCYVNNLKAEDKPIAINLPAGRAPAFRYDIDQLLEDVQAVLPKAFQSEEYQQRRETLQKETLGHEHEKMQAIMEEAESEGISITFSPTGVAFQPLKDGKPMEEEDVENMPDEERERLEAIVETLQDKILKAMNEAPKAFREARHRLTELNQDVARQAFDPLFNEMRHKYADCAGVISHLDAMMQHLIDHALAIFQQNQEPGEADGQDPLAAKHSAIIEAYRVNELVSFSPDAGAPVVYEDNPTVENLLGRIEYVAQMGTLVTNFSLIKPGSLHKANGGYLIVHAHRLFSSPLAWEALKMALRAKEIKIETPRSLLGIMSTGTLEPEPIPLDIKVILIGSGLLYQLLQMYDHDFPDLFKVAADFAEDMNRTAEDEHLYARLVATLTKRHELPPLDRAAVERVVEHASRVSNDSQKLSVRVRAMGGVLQEAAYWAGVDGREVITRDDVDRAIDRQGYRLDRFREEMQERIQRGIRLIDSDGAHVGQVNGLSVFAFGDHYFGQPSRITASTRLGEGDVLDIEREAELGGPAHSKGVLILQGFITGRYARKEPFSLSASVVFEQSYGGVDGDSATCAEAFALLSSIADIPLKQNIAVTGSMNQHGQVQAIGGVNEKIEGFFATCSARGLDGSHGVLIPASNVEHLMLHRNVREAVERGDFHIYTMETIDDGLELLTGMTAGVPGPAGEYPEGSVNAAVEKVLAESAKLRKAFRAESKSGRS